LENELVNRPGHAMIVAGIGVSLASCADHPCASWKGLLLNGLQYCEDVCGTSSKSLASYRDIIEDPKGTAESLISVAGFIESTLTGFRSGAYGAWLEESIGSIKLVNRQLVDVLRSLHVRIATTNYDHMLEAVIASEPITWRQQAASASFFRESRNEIMHLHGHFRYPDTVVLGARSYAEICRDDFAQIALRSQLFMGTVLFVGCGSGLQDPNIGALLNWSMRTLANCHHAHFALIRTADLEEFKSGLGGTLLEPIVYGDKYEDLTPYLKALAERVHRRRSKEPVSMLAESQASFEAQWQELKHGHGTMASVDFFRRSRALALELWTAGGRRRAALAFSSRVSHQSSGLLADERLELSLDAAQLLIDDQLPDLAMHHLHAAQEIVETVAQPELQRRYSQLRVRCMDALCAYDQTLAAVEESLIKSSTAERSILEAERDEIRLLQGEYDTLTDGESN
jgi:hypothetical protein